MQCSNCGAENPVGKKFCGDCGALVGYRCPQCGADNPVDKRFCGDCGAALSLGRAATPSSAPPRSAADIGDGAGAERRHLTVLFCDLVNSTEIAADLDPEDWRGLAARYQQIATEAVLRFDGHVAQYLGDGVLAFFGYPLAHENDAERAVRGGLAIIEGVLALNARHDAQRLPALAARVGIHAGPVVVGNSDIKSANVFGETPNVAARVQAAAEPNTVVVSAAIQEIVSGLFVVEDRGRHALKGIGQPVQLYRAIQPTGVRRRTYASATDTLTPFVGRDEEMRLLLNRWRHAREAHGQMVLIAGEPGIGKSRLVAEFRARIKDGPHLWIECAGEQSLESTPFNGVTQMLDQVIGWRAEESKAARVMLLERALAAAGLKIAEAVPLVAEMLNLPIPEQYPPLLSAPEQKRKRLLAALAGWVFGTATVQPLIIAMEDLHWVDPSTLELMQMLVEQGATAPLLLLYTARPEFRAPWPMRAHHGHITLSRLNDRHTRAMVAGLAARVAGPKEMVDAVVKRTDGVPLFAEELTRLILDGHRHPVAHEIPTTLHDSLTARLDRLGSAKEVAQLAALLGREFSYQLLQAVAPQSEHELRSALGKLVDAELLSARGIPPEASYRFKHALMQDAAYEALLKSRRRELHRRVAHTITEKFPALAEAQPEVIASHWTAAGEAERAIKAWSEAADAAYGRRRAFKEAERSYRQALAVLATLPESKERDVRELELSSALFRILIVTRGYTAPDTVETAAKARALAEKASNLGQLVRQVYASWAAVHNSGDHSGAIALADQLLDLAQREGSSENLGFAHMAQLESRYYYGDLAGTEEHLARLNCFLEAPGFRQFPGIFVIVMGFAGVNALTLGHPASAREPIARAVAFGRDSANPYDMALARFFESWLHLFRREPLLAEAASSQSLVISEENGFSYTRDLGRCITGWARAKCGRAREGVVSIRDGLAGLGKIGARLGFTHLLTLLAEAQALDGALADALSTLHDALQANPEEIVFRPDILSCRGELRLKIGQSELAEADFREAIALAQKMSAKAWELRATTHLARLLRTRGDRSGACDLLAPVYGWFNEGFDIADLKDAKALLDESAV